MVVQARHLQALLAAMGAEEARDTSAVAGAVGLGLTHPLAELALSAPRHPQSQTTVAQAGHQPLPLEQLEATEATAT